MPLVKNTVNIPFAQGIDTKTDPNQVAIGKFLSLTNSIFDKGGLLQKRNGFKNLTMLSANNLNTVNTYGGNLVAVGENLYAFSQDSEQWIDKGPIVSCKLSVESLVRSSSAQQSVDIAVTPSGLICTTWQDSDGTCKFQVVDSQTGQVFVAGNDLPSGAMLPRVFQIGQYFFITYLILISSVMHLQYVTVSINDVRNIGSPVDISSQVSSSQPAYDGQVVDGILYLAWNGSDVGGTIRMTYYDSHLHGAFASPIVGKNAKTLSICGDTTGGSPVIWISFNDSSNNGWSANFNNTLIISHAPVQIWTSIPVVNLTSFAENSVNTIFFQTQNDYSFLSVRSDYISKVTITFAGSVGSTSVVSRGVALASKAFQINSSVYFLVVYGGALQPTYFLIDSSGDDIAKIAYSNAGGYPVNQVLSNSIVSGSQVTIGYLFKDQLTSVNKSQTGSVGGIYSQTGINAMTLNLSDSVMPTAEIGGSLHFASGFLWMFDGVKPVEHGFHLWPEDVGFSTSTTGGSLAAQIYFYQVTYEWTDSQGNIHRSAPSVPIEVDLSASLTSTNQVTLNIPTLRQTYKTAPNSVRIMIWRWSTANQNYYQVTSIQSPTLNNPAVDSISFVDKLADSSIVGNALIYTTGGVLEDIGAPACNGLALFDNRLWLIDAEDENLLWFSKQVIQDVPVEMSDLLTEYVAPTTGAQGSTGSLSAITSMDDKLIMFKKDAMYYLNGTGPDNTGANNNYSNPTYITASVGCTNFQSIVFIPTGVMFQSDKGIWQLGRDLSSSYIGAPVQNFNSSNIEAALSIPGTNQARFTLDSGMTLMYDYFYQQWGTFQGIPGISSCLYQGLHTFLNEFGGILQESPRTYLDGDSPVLLAFTTGWMNFLGLQAFERAYYFYLLGQYISPHKLQVQIAYDYNQSYVQSSTISPDNFNGPWGSDASWGTSSPWGGNSNVEQWRVFLQQQKCQAFQIAVQEIFDPSFGTPAGAGLTLSGINLTFGAKKRYPVLPPARSVG